MNNMTKEEYIEAEIEIRRRLQQQQPTVQRVTQDNNPVETGIKWVFGLFGGIVILGVIFFLLVAMVG